jgi:hypothetical protein
LQGLLGRCDGCARLLVRAQHRISSTKTSSPEDAIRSSSVSACGRPLCQPSSASSAPAGYIFPACSLGNLRAGYSILCRHEK